MSRNILRAVLTAIMLTLTIQVRGNETTPAFVIDLADEPGSSRTEPVTAGTRFTILITHRANLAYSVDVRRENIRFDPLKEPKQGSAWTCENAVTCFENDFKSTQTESAVPRLITTTRENAKRCDERTRQAIEDAIAQRTQKRIGPYILDAGQELTVTVKRTEGEKELTWTLKVSAGPVGAFRTMYGFNFIPSRDDAYYLAPTADANRFTITAAHRRQKFDFAPSVFFSWLSRANELKPVSFAPVAGLGFDMSTPIVFAGLGICYRQNISLNVGAVMHQERRLNGKYVPGSEVGENLTDDQLYQKTFTPQFFFGAAFRFDNNPFSKKDDMK